VGNFDTCRCCYVCVAKTFKRVIVVVSGGITFISNFINIDQLVEKLEVSNFKSLN
jgi:hypothetical protein